MHGKRYSEKAKKRKTSEREHRRRKSQKRSSKGDYGYTPDGEVTFVPTKGGFKVEPSDRR